MYEVTLNVYGLVKYLVISVDFFSEDGKWR